MKLTIRSGDYFEFSHQGPLASYSSSADVPVTYDLYIENENQDQLFRVTASDDVSYSFTATATTFYDSRFTLGDGNLSVDYCRLLLQLRERFSYYRGWDWCLERYRESSS